MQEVLLPEAHSCTTELLHLLIILVLQSQPSITMLHGRMMVLPIPLHLLILMQQLPTVFLLMKDLKILLVIILIHPTGVLLPIQKLSLLPRVIIIVRHTAEVNLQVFIGPPVAQDIC